MHLPVIYKNRAVFGLDIGQHAAKFLELKQSGHSYKLIGMGSAPLKSDTIIEGVIAEPEHLAETILASLRQPSIGHIHAKAVAVGLPQAHLFTRSITLPAMKREKLAEAVQWESQQYIPMPMSDLYMDFEIIEEKKDATGVTKEYEIFLVAAPRAIIDSYMKLLEFLKLTPHSFETTLAANIRALHPANELNKTVLVLDVGSTATDMAIVTDTIKVSTTTPFGGDEVTKILATHLKISEEHANEIKMKFGIADSGLKEKIDAALNPALAQLIAEIQKLVKYHQERTTDEHHRQVEQLLLTGGASHMPGFAEVLTAKTKLPVDITSAWDHHKVKLSSPLPQDITSGFTTAFGLALRGFIT
ncbi:MAG: type pilus assembly protein PilM [Patescibacteria group bacterium]|nr:type pilus assembly protein PilM [Patescibacteria group bacterium]